MTSHGSHSELSAPLWSPERVLERMGHDKELVCDVIGYFVEDAPQTHAALAASIHAQAAESVRHAHSLKGLCGNYEAVEAESAAAHVEQLCRDEQYDKAADCLPELQRLVEDLTAALTHWKSEQQAR